MSSPDADDAPPARGRRGPAAGSDPTVQSRVPSVAEIREAVIDAARAHGEAVQRARPYTEAVREADLRLIEAIEQARDAAVVMTVVAVWVSQGEGRARGPTERTRLANLLHQQLLRHRRRRGAGREPHRETDDANARREASEPPRDS